MVEGYIVKLRSKVFILLTLISCFSVYGIYRALEKVLVNGLLTLEYEDHTRNVQRVIDAIGQSNKVFVNKLYDWATWDDSYQFIQDLNQEYIDSNLAWNTFDVLELNIMLYLDREGNIRFFRGRDYTNEKILTAPPTAIQRFIDTKKRMFKWKSLEDYKAGFIRDGNEVFQIVFRPITDSNAEKPYIGTLFYARYFRESAIRRLEEITHYKITMHLLGPKQKSVVLNKPTHVHPTDYGMVSGTLYQNDIFGNAIFSLNVEAPRLIYEQGYDSFIIILWLVVLLCLAFLSAALIMITRSTVNPIRTISQIVENLRNNPKIEELTMLTEFGTNEVGMMASEVHSLYTRVRKLADFDELTEVHNVRFFRTQFYNEYKLAQRHNRPLSLIIFDVDHFKKVNDAYGHIQGDQVLKTLGSILSKNIRSTDLAARYGGEEFVLLLPETDIQGASRVAEKLRVDISSTHIPIYNQPNQFHSVTVSVGAAQMIPDREPDDLIHRADEALYKAKNDGRNRITLDVQL